MAIRAFLLCGDEKAVQAVTHILNELDVSFEHSSEPAFSLKRVATQRFDLLIVDCDNAQNATQVFNSVRASNQNKTSIAIAIVEGKAGVPNAFRLGASLVLTKPVSLEQARNTVRTGIGMARREGQEVKPSAPAPLSTPTMAASVAATSAAAPAPNGPARTPAVLTPVAPTTPNAPTAPTAPSPIRQPETPKTTASPAPASQKPSFTPRPPSLPAAPVQEHKPALTDFTEPEEPPSQAASVLMKAASAAPTTPAPAKNFDSAFTGSAMTKDADTKADLTKPHQDEQESAKTPTLRIVDPLAEEDVLDPVKDHGVPSFGGMRKEPFAGLDKSESHGKRRALIAAVIVVVLAGAGCGAWLTRPSFRKLVAGEYLNVMTKIGAVQEPPQTVAEQPSTPAPAPTAPQSASSDPAVPAADATTNGPNPNATSAIATSPEASPAEPSTDANPQKTSAQPAKQDTSNGSAANASLLPTGLPAASTAKAPSSDLLEVPEDFADDLVVHRVHPSYPKQAKARKLHGTVVLQAVVSKHGKVDSLQLVSGDPVLAQAAADAVKQWRYKPYSHNGEPADFQTRVTVDFKLP